MLEASEFILQSLVEETKLTDEDASEIRAFALENDAELDESALKLGKISARDLALAKATVCEYPFVDIDMFDIDITNSRLMPKNMAERNAAFPLFVTGEIATVAMHEPLDLQALDEIRQSLRMQIDPVVVDVQKLNSLITRAYSLDTSIEVLNEETDELTVSIEQEPIVAAVNQILFSAAEMNASDIHVNPDEKVLLLRYRVDGVLTSHRGPAISLHEGIIQRLKVMAHLDVAQTRRPQDGKFRFSFNGQPVDVRLSLIPTIHGENAVLRLLSSAAKIGQIKDLGMPVQVAETFEKMIHKPHGMVLVTGPTGSGKTTTLYTALNQINTSERNIMTIEDPVEIRLPMIRQVQANAAIGLDFSSALRSMLRQDPDVILVGEIRDSETAKIATQAALTGHLVFSTLHTNDAVGAIPRLREFQVPAFAINNALLGVLAQRLVRKVCVDCATTTEPTDLELRSLGIDPDVQAEFMTGKGCSRCMNTGYKGRVGVYELFSATAVVRDLIETNASFAELGRAARESGMRTMLECGIENAKLGITTIDELSKLHATVDGAMGLDDGPLKLIA
ncbi:MAG: GspE/PulE family protein [Phycisphaerales bacterium]